MRSPDHNRLDSVTHPDSPAQTAITVGQRPERVGAVIVAYFAADAVIDRLLDAIEQQVEQVVVVDNTPGKEVDAREHQTRIGRIHNGANLGLAAAHNQGLEWLGERGCTHALLLDQDSMPAHDMVERLLSALRELRLRGIRVAAVGARWQDRHSGRAAPFVRLALGRMVPASGASGPGVECDTLVSSGCLIPFEVLQVVGPMDAALFIDQVDTEWGLRAQSHGFRLFGVTDAILTHGIGDSFVRPWFSPRRAVPVHQPVRAYYLVRNTVSVFFRRPAPWRWRLLQLVRLPGVVLVMLTQMPQKALRLQMVIRGVADGFAGRLGIMDERARRNAPTR